MSMDGHEVWGWGANDYGNLGLGFGADTAVSTPVRSLSTLSAEYDAYAGLDHACLIERRTGESPLLRCAGHNAYGQLGGLSGAQVFTFEPVPAIP